VAGGDLDGPEVYAGIEHRGYEGVAEHVGVDLRLQADGTSQPPEAPGGRVAVHPGAAAVEQDRPADAVSDRPVDGPANRGRQRDQDDLGALAAYAQHPVAVLFAEVGDVRSGGLEDPQAQEAEHGYQREIMPVR
jgi:hypothetical protein